MIGGGRGGIDPPPSSSYHSSSTLSSSVPSVQTLFAVATHSLREHHATAAAVIHGGVSGHNHQHLHATPADGSSGTGSNKGNSGGPCEAAVLARSSVQAGFLNKLGANIPEYKRRFFVLKPESNLYYYLSPNDTEPRGRIDLEGATSIEALPQEDNGTYDLEGRFRFAVTWEDKQPGHGRRQVIFEARSRDIGEEWMNHLKNERVSTLKERVQVLSEESKKQQDRIADLERQVEHFRMVEKDRDGALEDARSWKNKFGSLDEALRLLTRQIRKPPSIQPRDSDEKDVDETKDFHVELGPSVLDEKEEEKKEEDGDNDANTTNETDQTPTKSNRGAALLDAFSIDEMNVEEVLHVPGTYFSALSNACRQQRESLRLASIEAATAVDDVVEANERTESLQKRMQKAEKHLLKLWEENCTIRKSLKQKKREKRVLVREVKQLQQSVKELQDIQKSSLGSAFPKGVVDGEGQMADTMIGSDEERLIIELEEHVASSIRLHERLISGTDIDRGAEGKTNTGLDRLIVTIPPSESIDTSELAGRKSGTNRVEFPFSNTMEGSKSRDSQFQSLLDDDDSDSESERSESVPECIDHGDGHQSVPPSIVSSTGADMGDGEVDCTHSVGSSNNLPTMASVDTGISTPERPNPLLKLDIDDESEDAYHLHTNHQPLQLSCKNLSNNGKATSRLACPLADVVETRTRNSLGGAVTTSERMDIYHLTFYSRKIGIQFQKAPQAPSKPKGLLTDALTADLLGGVDDSEKTAAELRNVASIASFASGDQNVTGKVACPLALPEDVVLVCGFHGFDDSGNNQRPKLGARLVAFDGISVEIGRWTFDAIRKAIKSRGRPLTLSFRNDFLTTDQRATLTKAVMDVDAKCPRPVPRPVIQCERRPSATPSVTSALSHDSEYFAKLHEDDSQYAGSRHSGGRALKTHIIQLRDPDESFKAIEGDGSCCPPSYSSHSSLSSYHHRDQTRNFHSFSEAGSSTVLSTTLAPLMANLLKGVSERQERESETKQALVEPEYLRRLATRMESNPKHQNFQSNLL